MANEEQQNTSTSRGLITTMADQYGLEPTKFLNVLAKTILPNRDATTEQVAAFLVVANQYQLNPFIREIYAFPERGGGITPIVSVTGWLTIINRQPALDGIEFTDHLDREDKLTAVTCRIYRKDRSKPVELTEYMSECYRDTEPWKKYPARMLRHKALIQCARYAFSVVGIYDPDEGERIAESQGVDIKPIAERTQQRVEELKLQLSSAMPETELVVSDGVVDAEVIENAQAEADAAMAQDA